IQAVETEPDSDDIDMLIESLLRERAAFLFRDVVVSHIVDHGSEYLGKPYKFRNPLGNIMDCSGFVGYIYSLEGIRLPRTSRAISESIIKIPLSEVSVGDLLFFKGSSLKSKVVGHVGMVIENRDGKIKMMHSSRRGIIIDDYPNAYYSKRFLHAGRIPDLEKLLGGQNAFWAP
ncbi:MAG: C40 family peptidase, partial [Candidatus Cloacimonadaceae bacterium]|nr:C40 family peptidase [Candidatus Cloacimonadaceae bacterium]